MSGASASVPSVVATAGLVGGFFVARRTGRRELGGALFAAAGAWCAREWYRACGPAAAAGLGAVYVAAMGGRMRWPSTSAPGPQSRSLPLSPWLPPKW